MTSAQETAGAIPVSRSRRGLQFSRTTWVQLYTYLFSLLGLLIIASALPALGTGSPDLLLFVILGVVVELLSVELFANMRGSRVSAAAIITIAGVLVFGPLPAALIGASTGLASTLTQYWSTRGTASSGRASLLRRALFNMGMLAVSAALAGRVYVLLGGVVGDPLRSGNIAPLLAAVLVSEASNISILLAVVHLQSGAPVRTIWEQNFRWGVPLSITGEILGGMVIATAFGKLGMLGLAFFFIPVLAIGYSFRLYVNNMRVYVNRLEQANADMDEMNAGLLETLGAVIDAFDLYTYGHSAQVAAYAADLADRLGLPQAEKALIVRAALVHDIGKIGVMDDIIGKPGALTEKERYLVERHPIISADILRQMKGLQDLVPLVRHHHERWDGLGYPAGLSGEEIPLGARVIAVADMVDAMCSSRPYRKGKTIDEVTREIRRNAGAQFDPRVAQAFLALAEEKGQKYFKDSAASIDEHVAAGEAIASPRGLRYLKRSMFLKENGDPRAQEY